ncbi:MAG: reverse transcriptase/maturase family protein [Patescibacteria group bacterium]
MKFIHTYEHIISVENLLAAWQEFIVGKRNRMDVQKFELNLMSNIFALHGDLAAHIYRHSEYEAFNISDPKPRNIHKASVRDRLLHRAIYRVLYPFFDRRFIADSYSCRKRKGTHKAIAKFRSYAHIVSKNHMQTAWVLKCDIRKFFASIDQEILMRIMLVHIPEKNILRLISAIVGSFYMGERGRGLPLGNLTSQLFVNIYMNIFDQFMKHKIKAKYYIRYADDFVILSADKAWLETTLRSVHAFLLEELKLTLHPDKVSLQTFASGIDFLGWIHFPDHRVLRSATKKRMFRNLENTKGKNEVVLSYLGLMNHGNTQKLKQEIEQFSLQNY